MDYKETSDFLEKYQLFYRDLSRKGKERFLDRLYSLRKQFKVIGRDMEISPEMETLILSYPVQLTFGFSNFTIGKYDQILVYPSDFSTKNNNISHSGLTFSDRIIALSWRHFTETHSNPYDGDNLGIYHFAQAQIRSMRNGNSTDERMASYYPDWAQLVKEELERNQEHPLYVSNPSRVRTGDIDQLFPAIMEWFFERSIELKKGLPNTYAHLCLMMNLDPTEFDQDYRYDPEKFKNVQGVSKLPLKIKKKYTFYKAHWLNNLPFLSILVLPLFYYYYIWPWLLLTKLEVFLFWVVLCVLIYFGGKQFFLGRGFYSSKQLFLFQTIFGLAPTLLFLLHWLTFYLHGPIEKSQHKIADITQYFSNSTLRGGEVTQTTKSTEFLLADNYLEDYPQARTYFRERFPETGIPENPALELEIARSFLGFRVLVNKRLINEHEHSGY